MREEPTERDRSRLCINLNRPATLVEAFACPLTAIPTMRRESLL